MNPHLFSIGHSNQPLDRFLGLLVQHRIEALVDIRRFPGSRKYPHWNQKNLAASLQEAGIEYHRIEGLGGRRIVGDRLNGLAGTLLDLLESRSLVDRNMIGLVAL